MRITQLSIVFLLLSVISSEVNSQQISRSVISVLGKGAVSDSYIINQTAGEAIACTYVNSEHILTQGFQQPSLISFLDPEDTDLFDAIDVYPNPVTHQSNHLLTLTFRIDDLPDYYVEIYDSQGKRVYYNEFEGLYSQDITIDMAGYRQSLYFVHVFSKNRQMDRYFKIEKF